VWAARAAAALNGVVYSVGCAPTLRRNRRPAAAASAAAGRRTGLADPPEDWPAASPRDAAAVTPREPILARDGFKSDSDVFYDWNLSERTLRCIVS